MSLPSAYLVTVRVAGAEADVQPPAQRMLKVRRPNVPIGPLDQLGVRMAGLGAQRAQDGAIEALRRCEIRDGDRDVVEHPAEPTWAISSGAQWE